MMEHMDLSIYICPVYNAIYKESPTVVTNPSVTAPLSGMLIFTFPINESVIASCNNTLAVFFITIYRKGTFSMIFIYQIIHVYL